MISPYLYCIFYQKYPDKKHENIFWNFSGTSSKVLSTVFGISKSSIEKAVSAVGEALATNFVPHFWGFDNISRSDVIENHSRPLAQNLFCNGRETILVLYGTYIYLQKSGTFLFQRRTYSMHKWKP